MSTSMTAQRVRPLILVVDDEIRVRDVMRKYLEQAEFRVLEAESGLQALALLRTSVPDLIVLDVMLPEMDGFSITQLLRDSQDAANPLPAHPQIPIILLTARQDEMNRIVGLEIGADDYVVKPFSPRELVARIKAVLRRSTAQHPRSGTILHFGDFELNPLSRTLSRLGQPVALTKLDFDLLFYLASHPNHVFTHEQLLGAVWSNAVGVDRGVVTSHIYRLREKIESDPDSPVFLHTVWGVGYKFQME